MFAKVSTTSKPSKKVCILPFLRGLLNDPTKSNIICWTNKSKLEFQLVDQKQVAELWGATKPGRKVQVMSYGTMARSLREFVKNKKLEKMEGRTCKYRFVKPLAFGIDMILSDDFGSHVSKPQSSSTIGTSSTSGAPSPTQASSSFNPVSSFSTTATTSPVPRITTSSSPDDVVAIFPLIMTPAYYQMLQMARSKDPMIYQYQ